MKWSASLVVERLSRLHRSGQDLCTREMSRQHADLYAAAVYHLGSYRAAVTRAGIDYESVAMRRKWTKPAVIRAIKTARRAGVDLNWASVRSRRDALGRAASAGRRLFGSWARAMAASGLDADEWAAHRKWDRNTIGFELRELRSAEYAMNAASIRGEDPGLYAAAVRKFGSWDKALKAARIDPGKSRANRKWTRRSAAAALRARRRRGKAMTAAAVRRQDPALYSAGLRLYGKWSAAVAAGGG